MCELQPRTYQIDCSTLQHDPSDTPSASPTGNHLDGLGKRLREFRCIAGGVSLVVCEVCQLLLSPCKWRTLTTTPQLQGELYAPRRRKRSAVTCSNRQPIAKHAAATVELGVVVLLAQQNRLSHIDRSGCLVLTSTSSLHLVCEIIVTRCHLQ